MFQTGCKHVFKHFVNISTFLHHGVKMSSDRVYTCLPTKIPIWCKLCLNMSENII